jgi:hypothetical protein
VLLVVSAKDNRMFWAARAQFESSISRRAVVWTTKPTGPTVKPA